MLNELINEALVDSSFEWLCKQRKHFPANSDIWHLRFHWQTLKPVFYRRYMDDIIVLSTTRWRLKKAIRTVNQHFESLHLTQHPDKTTIGRITKGFDFLSYQFGQEKLIVSKRTLHNHLRRLTQLYEQKKHLPNWQMLLDGYRQHWVTWVYSGIPLTIISLDSETILKLFLKST